MVTFRGFAVVVIEVVIIAVVVVVTTVINVITFGVWMSVLELSFHH